MDSWESFAPWILDEIKLMTPCTPSLPGGSHQLQPRCLAALADAQDESFLLTRLCDRETFRPTDLYDGVRK